jgi:hypothetical protein
METLDMDAQRRELLFSQAHENVLRERSLLSAWHHAAFPSNSQQSNNNNNNKKNLLPRYGNKIAGKQDGARDRFIRGNRDRYYGSLSSDSLVLHLSHMILRDFSNFHT